MEGGVFIASVSRSTESKIVYGTNCETSGKGGRLFIYLFI